MSISLFFTAWNLDPVRTWLSPRKLGIVRISAESFTAADTFYESSHFPKPNSCALKKTCRNISASSKCTADQYYQFWCWEMTEIDILRTGHFLSEDRTRGGGIIRSRRLVLFPSFVWLFFSLNDPFFSICSKLSIKYKYSWNRRLAQTYILESSHFATPLPFQASKV